MCQTPSHHQFNIEFYVLYLCLLLIFHSEYDAVERLGVADAKFYLRKRFKNETIDYLGSCCVGRIVRDQIESEVDEALSVNGWTDVMVSR